MLDTSTDKNSSGEYKKAYNYLLEQALNRLGRKEHSRFSLAESLQNSAKRRHYLISLTNNINASSATSQQIKRISLPLDNLSQTRIYDLIDQVVLYCVNKNFCSDARFVEEKVNSMRKKGHSEAFIKITLKANHINEDNINYALNNINAEIDSAVIYLKRILRKHKNQNIDYQSLSFLKIIQSMNRKGFSSDVAYNAWYKITDNTTQSVNKKMFFSS